MKKILFVQFFKHKRDLRNIEMLECLTKNIENPFIDQIVLFTDECPIEHEKITIINYIERLTYHYWFKTIKELFSGKNHYILCNSDIYLDETIQLLDTIDYKAMILSRWENGNLIWNTHDSQDTWIISDTDLIDDDLLNLSYIELGRPGCDNSIAWILNYKNLLFGNPSKSIKTHHLHEETYTNKDYDDEKDRIYLPYLFVPAI